MTLRDASELLYPAVCEAVASLELDSKDAAAVKLARQYARTIDEAPPGKEYFSRLRWLGPELNKVLESLGATPVSRAAMKKPAKPADAKQSRVRQIRDAHSA